MDFDDRKKAFEEKYAHDSEMQFKVMALRNKLLGKWAADEMCKNEEDSEEYAKEVILSDFEEAGDDDVLRKVFGDLKKAGLTISEQEVREKMDELVGAAQNEIQKRASE